MIGLLKSPALAGALACALTGAAVFGYVAHLKGRVATLSANLAAETGNYRQCLAALDSAANDRRRDDAIDRIPDAGLRDAAREWLLEAAPGANSARRP